MGNLSSHKAPAVRAAIDNVVAKLCFLPPNSPDLNPTEEAFAKLKTSPAYRRRAHHPRLWNAIDHILDLYPFAECTNSFANWGSVEGVTPP